MTELKPCPFCGGKAEVLYTSKYECFVYCRRGCAEQTRLYKTKGSAIKAWNRRLPGQREIIRCKDCKHRDPEDKKCDCGHDILWQLPRRDDWFCADAERRTDE